MTRRVGRPSRSENRQQVLTFFPSHIRSLIKKLAASKKMSMSDYVNTEINKWIENTGTETIVIHRTHPRRNDPLQWVAVQLVLNDLTFENLKIYAQSKDVSIASLIYTIIKNNVESSTLLK